MVCRRDYKTQIAKERRDRNMPVTRVGNSIESRKEEKKRGILYIYRKIGASLCHLDLEAS